MVIINGQPYYQSTGDNSGVSGVWLPFIMCAGNTRDALQTQGATIPNHLYWPAFAGVLSIVPPRYIMKVEKINYKTKYQDINSFDCNEILFRLLKTDALADRFVTKEMLITSVRLSGQIFNKSAIKKLCRFLKLNKEEERLINTPIILANEPELETSDPDEVNRWLLTHKAKDCSELLHNEASAQSVEELVSDDVESLKERLALFIRNKIDIYSLGSDKQARLKALELLLEDSYSKKNIKEIYIRTKEILSRHRDTGIKGFFKLTWLRRTQGVKDLDKNFKKQEFKSGTARKTNR